MVSLEQVLSHYNVIGLAIAVAIGIAGKDLAFSLSNEIILPLVGKFINIKFFRDYKLDVDKFVSALLTFLIVTGVILLVLLTVLRPMVEKELEEKKKEEKLNNNLKKIANQLEQNSKKNEFLD